jgi:hypothetical protein
LVIGHNKGRLFGKINIIDLFVLLALLGIIAYGFFNFSKGYTQYYIVYHICNPDQNCDYDAPNFLIEKVHKGDILLENDKKAAGIVEDYFFNVNKNQPDKNDLFLLVKILTKSNKYAGQNIILGQQMTIKTKDYNIEGRIVELSKNNISLNTITENKTFIARFWTNDKDILKKISMGDHVLGYDIRQQKKVELAEIVNFSMKDSEKVVSTENGELLLKTDPLEKEVSIELNTNTVRFKGNYYFNSRLTEIGDDIRLEFGDYTIFARIINIK